MLKNVSLLFVLLIVISMGAFFIAKRHCLFSGFNPEILLNKYAENEIAHFSYFAFQEGKLRKWEGDIRLKIEEKTSIDEDVLNSIYFCVQQINSMVDLISVVEVEQNYNVSIALVDTLIPGYDGFTYKYYDEDYIEKPEIISGEIVIVLKGNKLPLINSTIHHEFTHLLGFNHNQDLYRDSEWTYKSLFNQSTTTYVDSLWDFVADFSAYSDLDKAAIRIMYDKDVGIDPGLTKKKFFRKIEKAKKEMRK